VNLINTTAEFGYTPGMKVPFMAPYYGTSYLTALMPYQILDRNTSAIVTGNASYPALILSPASGPNNIVNPTSTNWDTEIIIEKAVN
jgi:hypothetical protein